MPFAVNVMAVDIVHSEPVHAGGSNNSDEGDGGPGHGGYFFGLWWRVHSLDVQDYNDVIMTTMASQITSLTVVYSTVYSDADQRKHQSSASLAYVWGSHRDRWIPHTKGPVTRKIFPFDDIIME